MTIAVMTPQDLEAALGRPFRNTDRVPEPIVDDWQSLSPALGRFKRAPNRNGDPDRGRDDSDDGGERHPVDMQVERVIFERADDQESDDSDQGIVHRRRRRR